jgi:PAS domain S-box-containing protein
MAQDRIAIEGIGKRKTFSHGVYVTILLGILALATLYLTSLYNSLLYQTVIELFSVIVACAIFIVAWNSRSLLNNNYLLFVGIAYLFVAGLDGIHIISYTGTGLSPGYSNDLSIQLWIAARYIQSLSFLIAPLLLRRRLNISTVIVTYTIVSILLLVSIFLWGIFPTCFIEGTGVTLFKTVSDYVIALIFVSALILLDRNRQRFDKGTPTLLAASIGITIASELTLALNANAYAFPNFIGYMLKAVSFYLIYRAFIETGLTRPYVLLFSNLKQSEENMVKQSQELVQANTRLELEIAERKQVAEQLRTYQEHLEDLVTQRTAELSTSNMELQLEIAERKQAEEILDRVNRALKTLSECNQAMARATEESELLEEVCRALVRVGGYLLAWVGFAETDEAKTVRPVAHAGYEDGYLDTVDITWADTERGLGPVGTAIRTGQTCITRNIADDINFSIWRAEATKRGYASVITLPLFINGQILGSLNIYASEPDAFDADEVKQLTELADDLSFGITALRTRAEQKRAEEELRLKAQMLDAATDSIMLYDPTDGSFIYVNEAAYKSRGYTRDEVMRMKRQDLTAPQARRLSKGRHLKEVLEKGHLFFESIHQHKDGTTIPVEANVHVIETGGHKLVLSVTRDITERKQAEETLRESEEKYRKLVEGMQEGIWVIDKDACTTFVNPRMAEMLGYTVEEMQGKHLFYFMDEHDVELAKYQLERRKQGITEQHDFEFLRKDGARIYTSIETSPITDEKGNYMGALACVADITKRRQAEEQLKESEEKYSTLIERSNDGILIIKDGLVEFANTRMVDMVGYFLDEVLGKPFLEFVAPEHVELVLERYKKRMSGEDIPNNYEIDILTKDGRKIPVEINASRIEYQGGFADMAMVRDITERRKAETAVRESEEKYSTIVEKSNDGIIIIQDGILKFTNSRMIEMTGFSPDEALGKSFIEFVPPEHAGMLIDRYTRRRSGEKVPDNYETEILTRDGMKILVEVNVSQIEYKGKLVDIAIIRDITERKRAQEELKRSEERYRFLAENARDVIYRVSFVPAPHFEYVSPSVTAQLGYTPEECYADPDIWSKLIHPAYRTTMSEFGKSPALPKGAVITRWMRKDGTSIWAENSSTLFYDENGKVIAMQGISRDVTERVQAEQLYRTLASSSPVGVYIIQDNKFIFTNPKIQKDTGYTEEELLSKDTLSIIHPDDRESAGKNAIDILKGRRLQPYEYRYITKTGEARWALENVVSINYGGRQAVLGTPMDITERKQAQELYTTLANSSPVGIYIALDDRFVFANAMMQKNTGYTEEELLGKETLSIIHPEDKKSARENAIEMLKGKRTQPYEFRYLTKTGETRWALGRMTSVTYQGRQAILGVSINITEYKQAELLYHNLADSSPVGVYIYQDNKFIFTNPAFKKATGYTDDDLMGKDAPWIVHLEDRTSVDRNSIDMLKGKRLQPYEFRYITKSGETRLA